MYIYRTVREIHKKVSVCDTFMASLSLLFLSVIVDCNKKEKNQDYSKNDDTCNCLYFFHLLFESQSQGYCQLLEFQGFLGTPFLD